MNAARTVAKGWCPGALRPMESGDGLIARLRISGGIVSTGLAQEVAGWSQAWGNGQIDLTSRANLQIRGLSGPDQPRLRDAMAEWGLLDRGPEAEAVRNVIASPLAGLDPDAALDIRPIVRDVERRLADDVVLHALPGKFGFAIDDGGRLGLGDAPADVMFQARLAGDGAVFDIRLDGAPETCLGPIRPHAVGAAAAAFGRAFLARRAVKSNIRRMRDWIGLDGFEAIAVSIGLRAVSRAAAHLTPASAYLGIHPLNSGAAVGVGLPFGRIAARDLANLALAAERAGGTELRLTPWRAVLVPLPSVPAARALAADLAAVLILDPLHPLRRATACVGAPACARATTDVRQDAAQFAPLMPANMLLHVSGCAKGCAHPHPAAVTLVGRDGRYILIRDGAPWDRPVDENLTAAAAAARLSAIFPP